MTTRLHSTRTRAVGGGLDTLALAVLVPPGAVARADPGGPEPFTFRGGDLTFLRMLDPAFDHV